MESCYGLSPDPQGMEMWLPFLCMQQAGPPPVASVTFAWEEFHCLNSGAKGSLAFSPLER